MFDKQKLEDKYVNRIFDTNSFGKIQVLEYNNTIDVTIMFLSTGTLRKARIADILRGQVKDYNARSAFGVGVLGEDFNPSERQSLTHRTWNHMLERCYSKIAKTKHTTYMDASASEYFKYYSNFKFWCNNQIGFSTKDLNGRFFVLDKDILIRGNKTYSEDTCVFVPMEINTILISCKTRRGELPVGVTIDKRVSKKKYVAQISKNGKLYKIGSFYTEMDAFLAYKCEKETYIKQIANKWKDEIREDVYNALISWDIRITD